MSYNNGTDTMTDTTKDVRLDRKARLSRKRGADRKTLRAENRETLFVRYEYNRG